ncbi:MAG: PKD domain-containing protein [Candidatus Cloacimonetes bacterium]|nr:PKD domain-containing protein [Candidatus Cloacimonadota bacterium]
MRKAVLIFLSFFVITASLLAYAGKPEANKSLEIIPETIDNTEVVGNMRVDGFTGIPAALYNVNYQVKASDPETMARQYLAENADKLGMNKDLSDIEFVKSCDTASGYRVQFRQTKVGFPVYLSSVKVSINNDNVVVFVMNGYKRVGAVETSSSLSQSSALQIAKDYLGISGKLNFEEIETMVYQENLLRNLLVHKVMLVPAEGVFGDWEILVDAVSGAIVRAEDKTCYYRETGSGWVFDPDPVTNAGTIYGEDGFIDNGGEDTDSLTAQLKEVELLDITESGGSYSLVGPYAAIIDNEGPYTGLFMQDSTEFHYTRSELPFEAVNIYYHIDNSMRYLQELMGYEIMPYQYTGGAHFDPHALDGEVNAYYSSYTGHVAFGSPAEAVDAGEDNAIIRHELGHAIHDWITGGQLSQEEGLSEGCADYWAQSYTRSLGCFEPGDLQYDWFGLWGLQPEIGGDHLRVTNLPDHYPEGLIGDVHYDGQLWSSSLMSIYDLIGKEVCDEILWAGISMTDYNTNQLDAAYAFIQADMDLNDGANIEQIVPVFAERGYIAGPLNATFEADVTGGACPLTVNFTDVSIVYPGPVTVWEWDFENDGIIDSYEQNPMHIFTEPGFYTVAFTISDGVNTDTITAENYISVNTGILVYEGIAGGADFSGTYIYETLTELGIEAVYSNSIPSSFSGFDAVFLSFGNLGQNFDAGTFPEYDEGEAIVNYLAAGGKVYLESGSLFGAMDYIGYPNSQIFRQAFGIQSVQNYFQSQNPINLLSGSNGAITQNMTFTSSHQVNNWYIDKYTASALGDIAFTESGYGNVAVQSEGDMGHKTFAFAYSLADLVDNDPPSTRQEVLLKILDFFDVPMMTAGFEGVPRSGFAPLPVVFFDNSWAIPEIIAWAWDFDSDGVTDSFDQTAVWVFEEPGSYSVSLTIDNGNVPETLIIEDYIRVFDAESALEFNGVDSYLECAANAELNITEAVTLEAWINPSGWGEDPETGSGRIFDKDKFSLYIQGNSSNNLVFQSINEASETTWVATPENSIVLNEWQHVAVSYDGVSEVMMYINGVEQELSTYIGPLGNIVSNLSDNLYLGSNAEGAYTFQGVIDELRLWDTVVAGADIAANLANYLNGDEAGLKGYWKLNEGMGTITEDETVYANDCAIHAADWTWGAPMTQVFTDDNSIPDAQCFLKQNYPNPFNPTTTISYNIPEDAHIDLSIYNIRGQKIKVLVQGNQSHGNNSIIWNGDNEDGNAVSSGLYFYKLQVNGEVKAVRKCLLLM